MTSLEEGSLTLTAVVKDSEGNISKSVTKAVNKLSNVPEVKYSSVDGRVGNLSDNKEYFKIKDLKSTNTTDIMYYLVKGIDDEAPSVDEVINENKTITTALAATPAQNKGGIVIPDTYKNTACIVYVTSKTATGTEAENVLAVKVAKVGATPMEGNVTLQKVTGTDATYSWTFDEETEGFAGEYRVLLENSTKTIVDEKIVKKGESKQVDFFEILKKQPAGTYTIKVVAVADNIDYTDKTSNTESITTTAVLTKMAITVNQEEKTITWTETGNVANVKDYTIDVLKYDASKDAGKEYETIVSSETVNSITDYSIAEIVEKNGIGTYAFKVTANAKDDVLMANASSPDITKVTAKDTDSFENIKYHQGAAVTNLSAELSNGEVTIKGTLLSNDLFDITKTKAASLISYKLYYKKASETSYTSPSVTVTELPYKLQAPLNSGTEYKFMLVTELKDGQDSNGNDIIKKYYSNEPSITTAKEAIVVNNANYVKTEEGSSIVTPASGKVTYNNGVLYYNDGTSLHQYSSDVYPEVENIISVLDQMDSSSTSTDTISINGKITALTLKASATKATTYDLSKVPADAEVTIEGNTTNVTTIKGKLDEITLKSGIEFDLSGLTTDTVNVENANAKLSVNNGTNLSFKAGVTKITVNDVILEQNTRLSDVKVTTNGFEFTGSESTISIDANETKKDVTIEIDGNQKGLEITSSADYTVSVNTNKSLLTDFVVKKGKVDVSNAKYGNLKVGTIAGPNKVTLVTGKTLNLSKAGQPITRNPVAVEGLGYNMVASKDEISTYDTNSTTGELTIEFKSEATVDDYVTLAQTNGADLSVDKETVNGEIDTNHKSEPNLITNTKAIKNITVDGNNNTITVDFGNNELKKYKNGSYVVDKHVWYELLIDIGMDRNNITDGTRYKFDGGELDESAKLAPDDNTKLAVYLWADEAESVISFKETDTGIEHFYTIKVVNAGNITEEN